jgi:hypothetical protein
MLRADESVTVNIQNIQKELLYMKNKTNSMAVSVQVNYTDSSATMVGEASAGFCG